MPRVLGMPGSAVEACSSQWADASSLPAKSIRLQWEGGGEQGACRKQAPAGGSSREEMPILITHIHVRAVRDCTRLLLQSLCRAKTLPRAASRLIRMDTENTGATVVMEIKEPFSQRKWGLGGIWRLAKGHGEG